MNKDFTKELLVIAPTLDIVSIKEQNKAKIWKDRLLTLVANDDGTFTHNADDIKLAVEKGINVLKENLKDTDSLDDVAMWSDTLNILHTWLEGTRKESTSVFDEVKTSLMVPEKLLSDMKPLLKQKQNELNESIYKVRRINIFNEFQSLEDNLEFEIEIDFKIFESFADDKKKNKSFDVNTKGKLNAAAKKQILEQFHLVVDPIIKEKMLQEEKQKEQQLLTMQLSKLATTGTNEELRYSISGLNLIEDTLETYFPNIKDNAKNQILSLNKVIHDSIAQNDKIEKENVQNAEDLKFISQLNDIDLDSNNLEYLIQQHDYFSKLISTFTLTKNLMTIRDILSKLGNKIQLLKQNELKNVHVPVEKVEPFDEKEVIDSIKEHTRYPAGKETIILTHNNYFDEVAEHESNFSGKKDFILDNDSVEFLKELIINANSQDEAKKQMINQITSYLDMIDLKDITNEQ